MGLQLQNNSLTSLPMEIGQLTKLTKLNLSRNKLESLPEGIYKLTELRHLNVSFNLIQEISDSIAELNMLEKLVKLSHDTVFLVCVSFSFFCSLLFCEISIIKILCTLSSDFKF
jgi:Leucine-rich repeat (LRR) protein